MVELLVGLLIVVGCAVWVVHTLSVKPRTPEAIGRAGEAAVKAVVSRTGLPGLDDVYLPSTNGTTQIDHIVNAGHCIVVVETKNLSGAIYGGAHERNWRQSFGRGDSRSFLNPILQNAIHVNAVRRAAGADADVRGLVVMAGNATFRNGMPEGVIAIDRLRRHLTAIKDERPHSDEIDAAWGRLMICVRKDDMEQVRADHIATVERAKLRRSSTSGGYDPGGLDLG